MTGRTQAAVAQLAEALDSKSRGCGFDSHQRHTSGLLCLVDWLRGTIDALENDL